MSTTVSNPYSFNIKNNTSFTSSTIAPDLPSNDVNLVEIQVTSSPVTKSFIIPFGCKVIKVTYACGPMEDPNFPSNIVIKSTQKTWLSKFNARGTFYVGVTPNKTYTVQVMGRGYPACTIYYSASINNQTPTITDY